MERSFSILRRLTVKKINERYFGQTCGSLINSDNGSGRNNEKRIRTYFQLSNNKF